ncbi:hypothetical protein VTK73DRAFT_6271 [Phialemonium thermophilum]|uniref:Uncharacterized protein n=1 Tax=Phialemonium thermophilum TaxID=223376 RepID=A0ABR3UZX8_9PEZI
MRWALHPHLADALLGFGETKMLAFRTVDELGPTGEFPYASSGSEAKESSLDPPGGGGRRALGRLISAQGQSQMLLKRVQTGAAGLVESQYLLFDVGDVDLREKTASSGGGALLPYATLPPDIASRIREPLALLSRGRLAFLDVDRWVCTWRLPTTTTTGAGKQGDASSTTTTLRVPGPSPRADVEEHYFLPGDWVTSQETPLCTMTSDGILLCPRNGEIAVVQASRIRK